MTFSVESPANSGSSSCGASSAAALTSASTSSAVTKPLFSIALRSMPWRAASSAALRVTFACAGLLSAGASTRRSAACSISRSSAATTAIVVPSSTSIPAATSWTRMPSAGASISTEAFDVSTTHTGRPFLTRAWSSASHSARSADSLFASSRVSTISCTQRL